MNSLMNSRAGGTINTCRIVVPDTSHANGAIQASNGDVLPLGISSQAGRLHPDPNYTDAAVLEAAQTGEPVGIYPSGSVGVGLLCAEAWTAGDLIMADSNGKGIIATTGKFYVGVAESNGTLSAICPVRVQTGLKP